MSGETTSKPPTSPSDTGGFVYLALNPAWPGRVKVGRTTNPTKRLSQYQTASPDRDWVFAACVWFPDHYAAERAALKRLGTAHEWAALDSFFATKILNQLKEELHEDHL